MLELNNTPSTAFPYQLRERVGNGSMGLVYRALEPELERFVAVKFLHPKLLEEQSSDSAEEMRQRFLQEARAIATLSHPGIVTVHRVGEHQQLPFFAMEWLDGTDLQDYVEEEGAMGATEAVRVGQDLLSALGAAHQAGITHRDIKPANLMLLDDGRIKVTDFGIAHVKDSDLVKTRAGVVMGTLMFASPEQCRADAIDRRSDLYSVGMVLYTLLAGSHPFAGQSLATLINSIMWTDPTALHHVNPATPTPVSEVVHRSISKDPNDRYDSAAEMAAALGSALTTKDPVSPTADTAPFHIDEIEPASLAPARPTLADLPPDPAECAAAVVGGWPAQPMGKQRVEDMLDRLSEVPVHAPPFSGAAEIANAVLLFHEGSIVAAFDARSGATGEAVVEGLPEQATVILHRVPDDLSPRTPLLLSHVFAHGKSLHRNLDSSFTNLPALAAELATQSFDGIIRLRKDSARAYLLFDRGKTVLQLFSRGWLEAPVDRRWESWISDLKVRADVDAAQVEALYPSYRHRLKECVLDVLPTVEGRGDGSSASSRSTSGFKRLVGSRPTTNPRLRADITLASASKSAGDADGQGFQHDTMHCFLRWMTSDLPAFLHERKRAAKWKYLNEWLPLIRKAVLHHALPRPGSSERDFFDLATFDAKGKVLHLAHRAAHGSTDTLNEFIARVVEAKTARWKSGDVGAACLVAPSFDRAVLEAYSAGTDSSDPPAWEMAITESMTGYEGFVRLGARRGFHLLLVRETGDGFTPILPDLAQE